MSPTRRWALTALWLVVLAVLGYYVQSRLVISGDLRLFMPSPQTRAEKLILEEIGESPASRLLLIAVTGGEAQELAQTSQDFAAALTDDPSFRFVSNGELRPESIPDVLLAYRYLLSDTLDHERLDADYLHAQLQARLQDLSSPAASLLEPWIGRDPTLEVLKLAQTWQPDREPQRLYDVWFNSRGDAALLVVETSAAAFDPDGQGRAMATLHRLFAEVRAQPSMQLTVSGPGAFSVLMKERTQSEAQWLGLLATVGMVVLLLVAYRSFPFVVLGALPLLSAGLAGLAVVSALFGTVHGITLAFGFTLIGVAQDYPLHLFSHQHPGHSPLSTARAVWPALATGVASTCVAYLAFLRSGVTGLEQLACFTIAGLAVAGLTTRFLLPRLMTTHTRDYGDSLWLGRLWASIASWPRPKWFGVVLVVGCVGVLIFVPRPMWQNDLGRLTPVPQELLKQDIALRAELGAPDIRHLLVVSGSSADEVLRRVEALEPRLEALVESKSIAAFDHAARYLPSAQVQKRRQAALPAQGSLEAALTQALVGLPFKAGLFEPFAEEVARARGLPPLGVADLVGTPLELRLGGLLLERGGHWSGLVTLTGVRDANALLALASSFTDGSLTLLDLKAASEGLVARQREHILWSLLLSAVLLVAVVLMALRSPWRAARVITPMALTTLLILAALHGFGVELNLFHLIALVLAAGLGLDYALFFEHAADDPFEQRRTLHAVLVCSLSTLMVFALLACSSLPVLRAMGITVSLGVVSNFVLALLLTRPSVARTA